MTRRVIFVLPIGLGVILLYLSSIYLGIPRLSGLPRTVVVAGNALELVGGPRACLKSKNSSWKYHCYERYYRTISSLKDCETLSSDFGVNGDYRDVCFRILARKLKDKNICQNVRQNEDIISLCYEGVAEEALDSSMCEMASDSYRRGNCYFTIAIKTMNPDLCFRAEIYKDSCFVGLAGLLRDKSLCSNVLEEAWTVCDGASRGIFPPQLIM